MRGLADVVVAHAADDALEFRAWRPGIDRGPWDRPLRSYFRLDTDDIESIYADLRGRQDALIPALERYRGMRFLRQEPWECLVSYLCSAPASVERISQDMETLAGEYGKRVTLDGDARYTFP